jgi:hypothetical protein
MDGPIHEDCITNEELAARLKLVERDTLDERENSKAAAMLPERSDPPSTSRITLAIIATFAAAVTLAWLAFLVWLAFKGISLL